MALLELFERAHGPSETADGKRYVKVFVTVPALIDSDSPAIGALMAGASGVMGARVSRVMHTPDIRNSRSVITVHYESLTAFTGGDVTELARSRFLQKEVPEDIYVRRWAWNGTDAMPVTKKAVYPGTSGVTAPTCSRITVQREWNGGRHLVTAHYPDPQVR